MQARDRGDQLFLRVVIFVSSLAGPAIAQDVNSEAGQDLFMNYCWQCHGMEATGNGPMAEMLAINTPDLTRLSERNGDVFPLADVAMRIDGRAPLLAHGGEMPIFGPSLESDQSVALGLPTGQTMMTGLPLANILSYLESLQVD